jgi:uncharacterized RDD family membrane protein YckC
VNDDLITIETPEHIEVHYELAGIGSRALAGIVDLVLQLLITAVVVLALSWVGFAFHVVDAYGYVVAILVGTMGFLAATAYYVVCEMLMDGQSPGKRMAGLRVVRDDGTPLTFLDSAIRNIIRAVDMIPLLYTVGLVSVFLSKRGKRLGDMAAGTVVIKERLFEAPAATPGELPGEELAGPPVGPEVAARVRNCLHLLEPADLAAAERFLERRYELDDETRARIGGQLAAALFSRLPQVPPGDYPDPELFLETVLYLRREKRL